MWLSEQLGRPRAITKIRLNGNSFDKVTEIIVTCAKSGTFANKANEEIVKLGIRKYLNSNLDTLEKGLRITKAEASTSETNRPDFIAEDSSGRGVIIECKGIADAQACEQIERYGKGNNSRLVLVAFKITHDCRSRAKKNPRIELVECDLTFRKE